MYFRALQIATGSARFRELAFSNSAADNIFIIPQSVNHPWAVLLFSNCQFLTRSWHHLKMPASGLGKFCKAKGN
jgi:hypothetical protein